jgi:hypothetical protein
MTGSRICVAGIDTKTYRHVRPVTPPSDPLTRALLRENGGPFGAVGRWGRGRSRRAFDRQRSRMRGLYPTTASVCAADSACWAASRIAATQYS